MADNWQMEAVKGHFKVITDSLFLQKDVYSKDDSAVREVLFEILRDNLKLSDPTYDQDVHNVSSYIVKHFEGIVTIGFITIVMDEKVNGQLLKIPIFTAQSGNESIFINMKCFTFKNWDAYMQHTEKMLPSGKFCFPVSGHYEDNKRLKVDFAVCVRTIHRGWNLIPRISFDLYKFAESFFFNIISGTSIVSTRVMVIAKNVCSLFARGLESLFHALFTRVECFNGGVKSFKDHCCSVFNILSAVCQMFQEVSVSVAENVKRGFSKLWYYIQSSFFTKLNLVWPSSVVPLRLIGTSSNKDDSLVCKEVIKNMRQTGLEASEIFSNCRTESVYSYQNGKKTSDVESQELTVCNKALVTMTANVINKFPTEEQANVSENRLVTIYNTLKDFVNEECKGRYELYSKCELATKQELKKLGRELDVNSYQKSVGIKGDAETHFLMESFKYVEKSTPIRSILKKVIEFEEKEPVQLIQCIGIPNNKEMGLYKCIRMRNGLAPSDEIVKCLQKKFNFDEFNLVQKEEFTDEKSVKMTLFTREICVYVCQSINANNDLDAFMFIHKNLQ